MFFKRYFRLDKPTIRSVLRTTFRFYKIQVFIYSSPLKFDTVSSVHLCRFCKISEIILLYYLINFFKKKILILFRLVFITRSVEKYRIPRIHNIYFTLRDSISILYTKIAFLLLFTILYITSITSSILSSAGV